MKIVTVHNHYRSVAPSGENLVVEREGAALEALGHEVIRFERSSDEIEGWSRVKKATLPAQIIWSGQAKRDLTALLTEHRPDVVHVHNTFPLLSPAVLHASRDEKVPVVATIHNKRLVCASGDFFRNGVPCHDCSHGSSLQAVVHGCYRGSRAATVPMVVATKAHKRTWKTLVSAYLFVSASLRDSLAGLDFPGERVFVRHHLIPLMSRPAVSKEGMIFYAGRLDEAKGVRVLMASWDRYRESAGLAPLRLVIAGAGPLGTEVAEWASTRPSVDVVGLVDSGRCADLMSRASAVVLPSLCEETFGLAAVEAMAQGVAPLAAGHGSFTEIITDGVDGALFRPGDVAELTSAIADVAAHPAQYQVYGEQARKTYEHRFDPESNLKQLLEIYRFAIEHPVVPRIE
jgi:glycosyltransferase involved in cell wall biosynthesis